MIVIHKGEFVTCEKGHLICEVLADISMGDLEWTPKLGNFRIEEPERGKPAPPCPCGARWVVPAPSNVLHIEGRGWAL